MDTLLNLFFKRNLKLILILTTLLVVTLCVTTYTTYTNTINHDRIIVKNLHEMVEYYLTEEQKRVEKLLKKLTLKHMEIAETFNKNKNVSIDDLLKSAKKILEQEFLKNSNVAIINKDLIITDTTLEIEKGLDLKLFEDARRSAELVLKRFDQNYVNLSFPVYTPASNRFKVYTLSLIPGTEKFLQLAVDTEYFRVFSDFKSEYEDIKTSVFYSGGLEDVDLFDLKDGTKLTPTKELRQFIDSKDTQQTVTSIFFDQFYFKVLDYNFDENQMRGSVIYEVILSKKNIYKTIGYLVALEILVFLIIFVTTIYNQNFYKNYFLIPFENMLIKIKKGQFIQDEKGFGVEELNLLSESYNEMLENFLSEKNKLKKALEEIKTLKELLPICSSCKKIRSEDGSWHHIETYLSKNHKLDFTHGICPDCVRKLYPDIADEILENYHKKYKLFNAPT